MKRLLLRLLLALAMPMCAWGGVVRLQHDTGGPNDGDSTADATIRKVTVGGDTTKNFGGHTTAIELGTFSGTTSKYRALFKWPNLADTMSDLGISAGYVDSAVCSLKVYFENGDMSAGTKWYYVHAATNRWKEGTGTTTNDSVGVSWIYLDHESPNSWADMLWTASGGDYGATKQDSFSYVQGTSLPVWKSFHISKAVCSTWVANNAANYGILVKHTTEAASDTYIGIRPRNYATAGDRPILNVYYTQTQAALVVGGNTVIGGGVILGGK